MATIGGARARDEAARADAGGDAPTRLSSLGPGQGGTIVGLGLDGPEAAWLRAMGVAEGRPVRVLRRAPFGGPVQVRVGDASFALGLALAAEVRVGGVAGG